IAAIIAKDAWRHSSTSWLATSDASFTTAPTSLSGTQSVRRASPRRVSSAYDEAPDVRPLGCECDEVLTFRPNPSDAQPEEVQRPRRMGSKRGAYEQAAMSRDADAMTLLGRPPGGSGSARRREEVALEPPWPWREGGVDG